MKPQKITKTIKIIIITIDSINSTLKILCSIFYIVSIHDHNKPTYYIGNSTEINKQKKNIVNIGNLKKIAGNNHSRSIAGNCQQVRQHLLIQK